MYTVDGIKFLSVKYHSMFSYSYPGALKGEMQASSLIDVACSNLAEFVTLVRGNLPKVAAPLEKGFSWEIGSRPPGWDSVF